MSGYIGAESPIVDGWLSTGDLGFFHQERLYITGRSKDVIVLRGQNHSLWILSTQWMVLPVCAQGARVAVGDITSAGEQLLVRRVP